MLIRATARGLPQVSDEIPNVPLPAATIVPLREGPQGSEVLLVQRIKRDVDVIAGHVVFDYDTSRELAGALALGVPIARTAMV
mgnify:CR=1 FL=1